jgi:L-2-hydroxyglutarate oxidase
MVAFCREHGVAHEQCGKVVVVTTDLESDRARNLLDRGRANGLQGLEWLDEKQLRDIEPHARGIAAIRVPEEGIVDYAAVCQRLRQLVGDVIVNAPVRALQRTSAGWKITAGEHTMDATIIVNCAGLHADRVARLAGERPDVQVVPFRGEYYELRPERAHLVRNLIYPVPDPAFPFLGVHLTRRIQGGIEAGPNAVLALAREGYRWRNVNLRDLVGAITFPGLWRFVTRYPRVVTYEVARSFRRELFLRSLQRLVPELRADDLIRGPTGVRAQPLRPDGSLVGDYYLIRREDALHVLSAPSPAATSSLAIGGEIARLLSEPTAAR